jgi:hypothetical protein
MTIRVDGPRDAPSMVDALVIPVIEGPVLVFT